jgi:cellulose synthase/poly-beta-1,6-N-acetylglucosamine synthase-like glycosyltransferase
MMLLMSEDVMQKLIRAFLQNVIACFCSQNDKKYFMRKRFFREAIYVSKLFAKLIFRFFSMTCVHSWCISCH